MKLYLISQTELNGYDIYSEAVVAAKTEWLARRIHPDGIDTVPHTPVEYADHSFEGRRICTDWVNNPDLVQVKCIGIAVPGTKAGVICASFHAG